MAIDHTSSKNLSPSQDDIPGFHGVTIETPRLILRSYALSDTDIDFIYRLHTNVKNMEHMYLPPQRLCDTTVVRLTSASSSRSPPDSPEDSRAWIIRTMSQANSFNFVVTLRQDLAPPQQQTSGSEVLIGAVGGIRTPEFGYMIDSAFIGKGYATEAVSATVDAYFRVYPDGMPILPPEQRGYVECYVSRTNEGSLGVVRRLGFRKVQDDARVMDGEQEHNEEHWTMNREEWMRKMEQEKRVKVTMKDGTVVS
jgi:RimJ/RimL family protein N-acetyltransferase